MSVIAVSHLLEWPKWAAIVGGIVFVGAIDVMAAKQLERDSPNLD
jgi:hypothetical protein